MDVMPDADCRLCEARGEGGRPKEQIKEGRVQGRGWMVATLVDVYCSLMKCFYCFNYPRVC